jgi:hypothetical protein
MEDKSLFNSDEPRTISEGLQNFIDAMVEEIVLEGKPFDTQKKYLKKFSENEGLDYEALEKGITELVETMREMKTSDSQTLMRLALFQARECHVTETQIQRLAEQLKAQGTTADVLDVEQHLSLSPAKQNGLYGYIDNRGNLVIKPQFENAGLFEEGLAPVCVNDKWGYIDHTGKMIIEPRFDAVCYFQEGVAAVGVNDEFYMIDQTGKEVAEGVRFSGLAGANGFQVEKTFIEGLCRCSIRVKDGYKHGFVDKTGRAVIEPIYEDVEPFHNGFARVEIKILGVELWGFIDKNGKKVVKPQYDYVHDFEDGMAWVESNEKWGRINQQGEMIVKPRYEYPIGECSEGLMVDVFSEKKRLGLFRNQVQRNVENKYGFIDRNGNVVIDYRFDYAYEFHEGLAHVMIGDKTGFIDKSGQIVIEPRFDETHGFQDGFARVKIDGKWGIIDKTGKMVVEARYDDCFSFQNGMASVKVGDKWGFVDQTGKLVIAPQFSFAIGIGEYGGHVELEEDVWGYIDRTGKVIFKEN